MSVGWENYISKIVTMEDITKYIGLLGFVPSKFRRDFEKLDEFRRGITTLGGLL